MTVYYMKQDNTIWGCGDPECCGEYYEEIDDVYIECKCDNVTPEHLVTYVGGGPVLEWRKATALETKVFNAGYDQGWSDGSDNGYDWGSKNTEKRIIKLLEADCKDGLGDHIQGCSHEVAIALIKGETE